jgi:excisionase family DNA binding protein
MLRVGQAAVKLGVHPQTLRRWENEGKLTPVKTPGGQRRYTEKEVNDLLIANKAAAPDTREEIIYCRVSSRKQENDLRRQEKFMRKLFPTFRVISDISSGVNFRRPGLQTILELIRNSNLKTIAISYKDRLCRIGFSLFEQLSEMFGFEIIVVNNIETSPEQELIEDLLAITTSFSARIHGLRKYGNQDANIETESETQIEQSMASLDSILESYLQSNPGSHIDYEEETSS